MDMVMDFAPVGSHRRTPPRPLPMTLERAVGTLREAILNQELTSMLIAARRLYALAHAQRLGPLAWHAAAFAALCSEQPGDTTRMSELMAGIELMLEAGR